MAVKLSTGLRNGMLVTNSFKGLMDNSVLRIYSGTVPTSADAALSTDSTLLCEVSVNGAGTGGTFQASAAAGVVEKAANELWTGTVLVTGTATYARLVPVGDTGTTDSTALRLQAAIGTVGADINLSNTYLTQGNPQNIDYLSMAIPTL